MPKSSRFSVLGSRFSVLGSRFSATATLTSAALLVCGQGCDSSDPPRIFADESAEVAVPARILNERLVGAPQIETLNLEIADGPVCEQGGDGFYHHPLQGLQPVEGGYPFLDVRYSPSGKAYALQEGGHGNEEGEYEDLGSGVVELEVRPIDESEAVAVLPEGVVDNYVHQTIGPELSAWLETAAPDDTAAIDVLVARPWSETVTLRLHRAIAQGAINTHSEREQVRLDIMADVAEETAGFLAPVIDFLEAQDSEIIRAGVHSTSLQVVAGVSTIESLAMREDVVRLDLVGETALGTGADGQEKAESQQYRLFWDESFSCTVSTNCNYDGENGDSTDIYIAVVDPEEFEDEHVAFRGTSSSSSERIAQMWDCNNSPCTQMSDGDWSTPAEGDHGTAVLAAAFGDLRDGQDANHGGTAAREFRSAPGGESKAYLYEGNADDLPTVMDHVVARSPAPHLLVSSMGTTGTPHDWKDCNGDTAREGEVDQLFENGMTLFQLAGNDLDAPGAGAPAEDTNGIDGTTTNCTVWEPGSAISAFTVGAYNELDGEPIQMRGAAVHAESAWGGSPSDFTEGRLRTVIDMLAPWEHEGLASWGNGSSTNSYADVKGTSFAAPNVAGLAVAFIDMLKNLRSSNAIDDPGMLHAWMLNMGGRGNGSTFGARATTGFHQRYGAGRITNRLIGLAGMDSPWYWYHWEICVDHGTSVDLSIAGGAALSGSIDSIRATAWWYDRRFNAGTALDNIGLALRHTDGTLIANSNTFDSKERVYAGSVGGDAIKLVVSGTSVTSDVEGCGTNSMRVWVTALIEDDERLDSDGPTWDATDKIGVQPL